MSDFIKGYMASLATDKDKIRVKRIYIDINDGNLYDGVLFSQIMYWHEPSKTGGSKLTVFKDGEWWLAKQLSDWWEECRIKEATAKQCINRLVDRGLLIRQYWRYDGKRMQHLRIDFKKFEELLKEYSDISVRHLISDRSDISYPTGQTSHIRPITETTTETTTKTPQPPATTEPKLMPTTVVSGWVVSDRVETPKAGHGTITAVHRDTATVQLDSGTTKEFMHDVLTRSTKPAPQADPADALIDAYCDETKAIKDAVETKANRKIATGLSKKGITPAQLRDYLRDYAKPEWRTDKVPHFASLGTKLPAWITEHKPKPVIHFDPENPVWQQPARSDNFRVFDDDGTWIGTGPEAAKELERRRAERAESEGAA